MSGAVAIAYWLTVIAVKRDRCGEPMPSLGGWKWIVRTWESFGAKLPINLRAFQSPAEAHFWYEWRLKGWAMPLIVILGYLFIGSIWCIQMISGVYHGNAIFDFQEVNFMSGAMIAGVAGFIGLLIGISSTGSANRNHSPAIGDLFDQKNAEEMGHFLSTRPFTNSDFGKTCLRMTGRSLLITWTIWMAIFMSGLIAEATTRPIHTPFFKFAIGAWYLPLVMLGSWITMANLSAIGLSGRGTRLIFTFVSGIIVLAIAATVIEQRCSDDVQQNVYQASLWIASIAALITTPIAIRKAHRRGLLSVKALWILAAVSAGIAVPVIAVESKALPILAYPMILAFAALFILPFATIPLAITWNRHR